LDAGSGPIQYAEYLTYSAGYRYRVCLDLSITALKEARNRIGDHGLFVVADVTHMPFKSMVMDGAVTLHTFHHLPAALQKQAYLEIIRTLSALGSAVVVNGWTDSWLMNSLGWLVTLMEKIGSWWLRIRKGPQEENLMMNNTSGTKDQNPKGTYVTKIDYKWLKEELDGVIPYEVFVWRSVSVRFMRAVFHPYLFGRAKLALVYQLEELFPKYFGRVGQYPLIVLKKNNRRQFPVQSMDEN
jgi:SAM-dependent methyltransferase